MSSIVDILQEVAALCATIDSSPQLWSSYDALKIDLLESQIRSGRFMWVIDGGQEVFDPDWSKDVATYRCPISVYFVGPDKLMTVNNQSYVAERLEALRDAIRAGTFTYFQQIEPGYINTAVNGEVMSALLGRELANLGGGVLHYEPGVLYVH